MRYLLTLLILMTTLAQADVSPKPPTPPKPAPAPQPVDVVEKEKPQKTVELVAHLGLADTKLEIPRKVLEQLNSPDCAPAKKGSGLSPRKALTTGFAVTLAIALSGLWFSVRRPGHARHVLLIAAIAMLALSTTTASWADAPPSSERLPIPPDAKVEFLDVKLGKVTIEVVDNAAGSVVTLTSADADTLIKARKEGDK